MSHRRIICSRYGAGHRSWTKTTFKLTDGGDFYVKVICPGHLVANNDFVWARGLLNGSVPPAIITSAQYGIMVLGPRTPINGLSDLIVGKDLQEVTSGQLPTAVPYGGSLKVTVTSTDPSKVLLSNSLTGSGSASTTVIVPGGSTVLPSFYVHGLDSTGVVDVTAMAPGGYAKTFKVTLVPSGFVIYIPSGNFSTTTFAADTVVRIRSARLNPTTLVYAAYQEPRGGMASVSVDVTSSDTAVGTITTSTLTFTGGTVTLNTAFDPANAGTSTIEVSVPAGWSTPSNRKQITATVTVPDINAGNETVGKDLQVSSTTSLEAAPPSPVDIVVTVGSAAMATLTTDPAVEGTGSLTFAGVSNTNAKNFYVQGRGLGTTTLTITAAGYNTKVVDVTVDPSGFVIHGPTNFSTTVGAANTLLAIRPAGLNPSSFIYVESQSLRGGMAAVSVDVTSSDTAVGVITTSPLIFNGGVLNLNTYFDPLAVGTSTLSVSVPSGFSTPTNRTSITATVNP